MRKPKQAMQEWFDELLDSDSFINAVMEAVDSIGFRPNDNQLMGVAAFFFAAGVSKNMPRSEFDRLMGKDD